MEAPLIRPVSPADIPAITAIYGEAVRTGTATFELDPPGAAEMEARRAKVVGGGFPYLVATAGAELLGYAYAGPYHTRAAYRLTLEDSIYLAAEARGRGVGTALLGALLTECERRGFRQMVAIIGDSGNAASRRLHARHGFTLTGTLNAVGWKHGRWLDSVLMQRALGEGAGTPPAA